MKTDHGSEIPSYQGGKRWKSRKICDETFIRLIYKNNIY